MPRRQLLIQFKKHSRDRDFFQQGQILFTLASELVSEPHDTLVWQVFDIPRYYESGIVLNWDSSWLTVGTAKTNQQRVVDADVYRVVPDGHSTALTNNLSWTVPTLSNEDTPCSVTAANETMSEQSLFIGTTLVRQGDHTISPLPFSLLERVRPSKPVMVKNLLRLKAYFTRGRTVEVGKRLSHFNCVPLLDECGVQWSTLTDDLRKIHHAGKSGPLKSGPGPS
ncbi:hypothetical protein ABKN59_000917 [Abortiporus biennis]